LTFAFRYRHLVFECEEDNATGLYGICFGGSYDPLLKRLNEDDVVLDAGANVGTFSILASKIANTVFAIEPNVANFEYLKRNIALNQSRNVVPLRIALSDRKGAGFLRGNGLRGHLASSGVPVQLDTIEGITHGRVTAIKMDIEGAELRALEGLKSTDNVKAVAVETDGTYNQVTKFLIDKGFTIDGTYLQLTQRSSVIRKVLSRDMVYNELRSKLLLSRALLFPIIRRRFDPFLPLRGTKELQMVYAHR
jgi:FkbM family methyltransferase